MDRDTERLHEAREEIDRTLQRLESLDGPSGPVEGADERKVVRVRVTKDGLVDALTVDHGWRSVLDPAELAPAITRAYAAAGASRIEEWTGQVDEALALPEPRTRPLPTALVEHLESLPPGVPVTEDHVLRELMDVWAELEAEIDAATGDLEARVARTHRASSQGGDVHVEVSSSGGLLDLELRASWLERAHPANIGRTVLATIQQAQQAAFASYAETSARAQRSTAELTRLGDPTRLGRRLGLDL